MKQSSIDFIRELAALLSKHDAAIMIVPAGSDDQGSQLAYDVNDYKTVSRILEGRTHTTGYELLNLLDRMVRLMESKTSSLRDLIK